MLFLPTLLLGALPSEVPSTRWTIEGSAIVWRPQSSDAPHADFIETSGLETALILRYGTQEGNLFFREIRGVWPRLRTIPNDTHASFQFAIPEDAPRLTVNGEVAREELVEAKLDGTVRFRTRTPEVEIERTIVASVNRPVIVERLAVRNRSSQGVRVGFTQAESTWTSDAKKALDGPYVVRATAQTGKVGTLGAGKVAHLSLIYSAAKEGSSLPSTDVNREIQARERRVKDLKGTMVLKTPAPEINQMFAMAKVRAIESIFETKNGKIHCPGGGPYYAAIWANDQAEYSGPLFGMVDDAVAQEAGATAYHWFAKWMNPEFKPIPSSIIAEGESYWNGAGDRGDMAMIAYGAARFVLAKGDREEAERQWPLIVWCLDYLKRQVTPEGVIASDSDELEGRFPAGKANLNTAALTYDALLSAAALAEDLGKPGADKYRAWAKQLRNSIENTFGAEVEGFHAYRYYDGNEVLRAWICTPLTMDITERTQGTLDALFSPRLWNIDGLATQAGEKTFWDRATLYGFRGAMRAGETERVMPFLTEYVRRRTLGDHVPYAIEAWPEGGQRHLSAESALFVRVFTEGMFGLRPVGLRAFEVNPRLPKGWPNMELNDVWLAGRRVSFQVARTGEKVELTVRSGRSVKRYPVDGQVIRVAY